MVKRPKSRFAWGRVPRAIPATIILLPRHHRRSSPCRKTRHPLFMHRHRPWWMNPCRRLMDGHTGHPGCLDRRRRHPIGPTRWSKVFPEKWPTKPICKPWSTWNDASIPCTLPPKNKHKHHRSHRRRRRRRRRPQASFPAAVSPIPTQLPRTVPTIARMIRRRIFIIPPIPLTRVVLPNQKHPCRAPPPPPRGNHCRRPPPPRTKTTITRDPIIITIHCPTRLALCVIKPFRPNKPCCLSNCVRNP